MLDDQVGLANEACWPGRPGEQVGLVFRKAYLSPIRGGRSGGQVGLNFGYVLHLLKMGLHQRKLLLK